VVADHRMLRQRAWRPVTTYSGSAVMNRYDTRRRQTPDSTEDRLLSGYVSEQHVLGDGFVTGSWCDEIARKEGFDLRREHECIRRFRIVQRLYAHSIARQEKRLVLGVPNRKREHPVERLHASLAPFRIQLENHLGITAGCEGVALVAQLRTQ